MIPALPFRLLLNRRHGQPPTMVLPAAGFAAAWAEITAWPGYAPTPLVPLPDLAAAMALGAIHYKDESGRFGLGSFKALGGAYAVRWQLGAELARRGLAPAATTADLLAGRYAAACQNITFTCATDGNHGRAVAWGAKIFGARAVIFVHSGVSEGRRRAITDLGAAIRIVPGTYDDAVREAARQAAAEGWLVVSDTAWPGLTEVPRAVMQGYRVMAAEAAEQLSAPPTHLFIQAGVGGAAAAVAAEMRARYGAAGPKVVVVEPETAACLLASAEAGRPVTVGGDLRTVMAGLACGQPSLLAWEELAHSAFAFMAIGDRAALTCLKLLAARQPPLIAGESAVAGLAALLLAAADPLARGMLGLDRHSRVLLFGTEGVTDPLLWQELVGQAPVAASSN